MASLGWIKLKIHEEWEKRLPDRRDPERAAREVAELFDCDDYWYLEWSRGEPDAGTQMTTVPAAVRQQVFTADLETWDLSRWGRFVELPLGRPWKWSELESSAPTLIEHSIRELTELDPRLPSQAAAYMRLVALEVSLFYLLQLCLGEDQASWWTVLDQDMKRRLSDGLAATDDLDELQLGLTFTDFQRIVRSSRTWDLFAPVIDPTGTVGRRNALAGLEGVAAVRNRVMHPIRLLARPIRPRDLELLDEWLVRVRTMISTAQEAGR